MLKSVSFWEKADPARQHEYEMQTGRIFRVVYRIVSEGLQSGDLPPNKLSAEQIVFSIGSMAVGTQIMARNIHAASMAGIHNTFQGVCQNINLVLDGLGWKPLSSEWDYQAVAARIKREVFPEASWFKG